MNEDITVWEVFGKAQCPVEIWGWDVETGCSFMMRRFEQKEVSLGDFRDDPVFQTYAEQYIVKLTVKNNRLQAWVSEL